MKRRPLTPKTRLRMQAEKKKLSTEFIALICMIHGSLLIPNYDGRE